MSHPYAAHKESVNSRERAKSHVKGYASGGALVKSGVGQHESALHSGSPKTKLKLPSVAEGARNKTRLDRTAHARGGRTKKATTVNVLVNAAPQDASIAPVPMPAGGGGPPMAPPPAPPMAAAGAPMPPKPGGMPGGGMPMMRARGGKVMTAGAGTGEGRLEKVAAYGDNAKIKDTTKAVKGPKGDDR